MKKTIVFEFIVGLLLLVSALFTYIPQAQYMYELTFISNIAGAAVFLADAVIGTVMHRELPRVLFLTEAVTIGIVFLISVGGTLSGLAHFNFNGGMFFLHVINPLLVIGFYLFIKGEKTVRLNNLLLSPCFVMLYLLFDYIRFRLTGSFVYGLLPGDEMSLLTALLIGLAAYLILAVWGFAVYMGGRAIHKRKDRHNSFAKNSGSKQ